MGGAAGRGHPGPRMGALLSAVLAIVADRAGAHRRPTVPPLRQTGPKTGTHDARQAHPVPRPTGSMTHALSQGATAAVTRGRTVVSATCMSTLFSFSHTDSALMTDFFGGAFHFTTVSQIDTHGSLPSVCIPPLLKLTSSPQWYGRRSASLAP